MDSTARHLLRENSNYVAGGLAAEAGDFKWATGTLAFGSGEVTKTVTSALEDQTFDGDINEVFLLRLSSTTCEGGFVASLLWMCTSTLWIMTWRPRPCPRPYPRRCRRPPTVRGAYLIPLGRVLAARSFRLWAEAGGVDCQTIRFRSRPAP